MNEILFVALKVVTTLSTVGIYLSPVPSMRRILRNKSPGQMQIIPLVVLFINCFQKMLYGISIDDIFPIVFTVLIGQVLAVIYVSIFTKVTSDRAYVRKICLLGAVPIVILTLYVALTWSGATHQTMADTGVVLGYVGVLTSIGTVVSPLMTARRVVRTKDAASIPIELCTASFVSNSLWVLYGITANEVFVWAPNTLCVGLGVVQISLYVKYNPNKRPERRQLDGITVAVEDFKTDKAGSQASVSSPRFHALRSPPLSAIGNVSQALDSPHTN